MSGQAIQTEVDAAFQQVAQEVGAGSFTVTLKRVAADDPTTPWGSPALGDPMEFTLPALLDRWSKNEIDGTLIRATDLKVMASAKSGVVPTVADRLVVNASTATGVAPTLTVEEVDGDKDGVNDVFTISKPGTVAIYYNGQRLVEGDGYTRDGLTITAIAPKIPGPTDTYVAEIYSGGDPPTIEDVAGTKNGANLNFTITKTGIVALFLDGVRQVEGVDYEISGTAITMTVAPGSSATFKATIYSSVGGVEHAILNVMPDAPSGVPLYYIIHARQ